MFIHVSCYTKEHAKSNLHLAKFLESKNKRQMYDSYLFGMIIGVRVVFRKNVVGD